MHCPCPSTDSILLRKKYDLEVCCIYNLEFIFYYRPFHGCAIHHGNQGTILYSL